MDVDRWVELEYQSLREEILATIQLHHSTTHFFLPATAAVYAVPYLLQQTSQMFLWSVCAGLAGLMITAMNHTLFASVDGVRRLGAYIKEAIEPRTQGGLRWEAVIFHWDQRTHWWPTEHATIAVAVVIANIATAGGAGLVFGHGRAAIFPIVVAGALGLLNVPIIFRMWTSARQRKRHATAITATLRDLPG